MSSHSEAAGSTPAPSTPVPGVLRTSMLSVNAQSTMITGASAPNANAQKTIVGDASAAAAAPDVPGAPDASEDPVAYWWPVCRGE